MPNFSSLSSLAAWFAGSVALLVALLLVVSQSWHGQYSMDSTQGVQKFHDQPTCRVGGIAIVTGVVAAYLMHDFDRNLLLGPLIVAGIPAFAFGLLEDITKRVSVRTRLLATMSSGVLGWAITGYSITYANVWGLDWLLGFTVFSVVFTSFAVGGVANALNIIDGFNGLSGGTALIILAALAFLSSILGDEQLAITILILAGAVAGFLIVNWPMGKIFLGDGGAYFLGFVIAWLAVLLLQRHNEVSAWTPLLMCGFPIIEVLLSIVRRHRRKVSLGAPDRLHLHSLVKCRLVPRLLPRSSTLVRNSATGALMWLANLLPVAIALQWRNNTFMLILGFAVCVLLYSAFYVRLTQFRWCFSPATIAAATASKVI